MAEDSLQTEDPLKFHLETERLTCPDCFSTDFTAPEFEDDVDELDKPSMVQCKDCGSLMAWGG